MDSRKQNKKSPYSVQVYSEAEYHPWNSFVSSAKNATFLFHRDFMEYHKDRFTDFSLMIYKNQNLVAVLPANKVDGTLYSHQGLTYGGLVLSPDSDLVEIEEITSQVFRFIKYEGFYNLILKSFPDIYQKASSVELAYVLQKEKASIINQNLILAIDLRSDFKIHKSKLKRFRKCKKGGFQISEDLKEFQKFWTQLLIPRLQEKHQSTSVHSFPEILQLQSAFPDNIVQYNIYKDEELLAGITIFKSANVVKSQYGIASKTGERLGALDMLFVKLIDDFKLEGFSYFSMGTINDDSKIGYNVGMLKQKQEFGCQMFLQPVYQLDLND